jgi:phage-related protein
VDAAGVGKTIGENVSRSVGQSLNFQSVGKRLQDLGGRIATVGDSLTKYITLPAGIAATAVVGITSALGWSRLSGIDVAQSQLLGFGYTADDVNRITDQLATDLEGGMMTMGEATAAAATAMAAGVEEGAELTKYIQTLDAAGVASTGTLEEMAQLFGVVTDQGHLTRNEFDMISRRIPGFSAAIQDHYGVTSEAMYNMLREGGISSSDFVDIMADHAGAMATEYAKTWPGMVQNTKAWIGVLGQQFLGGVFEESKEALSEFIDFLSSDEVIAWAADIGVTLGGLFSSLLDGVRSLIEWWGNLSSGTQKAILAFAGIAVAAGPVLSIVGRIIGVVGRVTSAIGTLLGSPLGKWLIGIVKGFLGAGGAGGGLMKILMRFAGPVGLVVAGLIAMWNSSETFREGVMDLAAHVWDALQQIGGEFQRLWELIQPLFALMGPAVEGAFGIFETYVLPVIEFVFGLIFTIIKGAIDNVVGVITGLVDVITGIVAFFQAIFTGDFAAAWEAVKQIVLGAVTAVWNIIQLWLVGRVLQIFRGFGSTISALWSSLWTGIRTFVSTIWNAIVTLFSNVWTRITAIIRGGASGAHGIVVSVFSAVRAFFATVWNAIRTLVATVWNSIRSAVSSGANAVRSVVSSAFNAVRNVVSSVMNGARNIAVGAWNAIRSGASSAMSGMRSAVSSGFSAVTNTIRNLPNTIRNVFSNAGSWLINAGKNILSGLTKGIRSAISGPVDAVRNGVQRIRNLLPFSPAKDGPLSGSGYTLFSGQTLIEDLARGIADASPNAIRSMSSVVEELASQADLSAMVPDFIPDDWTHEPALAGAGVTPSARSFASTSAGSLSAGPTVQMTNQFTQADPDEAVAIMWSMLRSAIRSNGGGDIGANPNA